MPIVALTGEVQGMYGLRLITTGLNTRFHKRKELVDSNPIYWK